MATPSHRTPAMRILRNLFIFCSFHRRSVYYSFVGTKVEGRTKRPINENKFHIFVIVVTNCYYGFVSCFAPSCLFPRPCVPIIEIRFEEHLPGKVLFSCLFFIKYESADTFSIRLQNYLSDMSTCKSSPLFSFIFHWFVRLLPSFLKWIASASRLRR